MTQVVDIRELHEEEITSLIDNLTYSSYKVNRGYSPETTPEQWARIYGDTSAMEKRFQNEKLLANALPRFFESNEIAMADIRRCAEEERNV